MSYILTIVGARPQFVKAAVVSKALSEIGLDERIIHTGQHYDHQMSAIFWEELNIPLPMANLDVGSGNHGEQTGKMLQKLEAIILNQPEKPIALLVYGDTNSTLAGAIVASKLHIPIIHVEAGLRSYNKKMPEEINRIMTDHVSDILFCSSEKGIKQLAEENITKGVYNVGDVMYDALLTFSDIAKKKFSLSDIVSLANEKFILTTLHRPSNTENLVNLNNILEAFSKIDSPVFWPVHPRIKARIQNFDLPPNLILSNPVSYFEMLVLLSNCYKLITDSGGLQKESYWMKKQCITIRDETEWTETLIGGWNSLVGANTAKIIDQISLNPKSEWKNLYGNGNAAKQIASVIKLNFS
jgi:UDP-GlcNAc3NAcA epimerase